MTAYLFGFGALLLLAFVFLWQRSKPWLGAVIAACSISLLASLAYIQLGAWQALRIHEIQQLTLDAGQASAQLRQEMIQRLRNMVAGEKSDPRYAYLLGHALLLEEDYEAARREFSNLRERNIEELNVDLGFVQSDFLAGDGVLGEEARSLAWQIVDSNDPVLLEILVLDSLRQGDQAAFLQVWPKYSATPRGVALAGSLGQVSEQSQPSLDPPESVGEEAGDAVIRVEISLAPETEAPGDTPVFVLARDAEMGGPPLAVKRLAFSDLPILLVLSDDDAMLESRKLSHASKVEVVARIAFSGGPIAAEGDLEASSGIIDVSAGGASVHLQL